MPGTGESAGLQGGSKAGKPDAGKVPDVDVQ